MFINNFRTKEMLEKIYKSAVILIAVLLIGGFFYLILTPTKTVAQATSNPIGNYVVPESHVWEVIHLASGSDSFVIYNKKTGEFKILDHEFNGNWRKTNNL